MVGATIEGTGIPANTTISSIDVVSNDHNGTITISAAVTHGGINGSISSITSSGGASGTIRTLKLHLEEETGQNKNTSGQGIPATTIRKIVTAGSSNNGTIQLTLQCNCNYNWCNHYSRIRICNDFSEPYFI